MPLFPVNTNDTPNYSLGTMVMGPLALAGIDPITASDIEEVTESILFFVTEPDFNRPDAEKTVWLKNGTRPAEVFRPGHRTDLEPGDPSDLEPDTVCQLVTVVLNEEETL